MYKAVPLQHVIVVKPCVSLHTQQTVQQQVGMAICEITPIHMHSCIIPRARPLSMPTQQKFLETTTQLFHHAHCSLSLSARVIRQFHACHAALACISVG